VDHTDWNTADKFKTDNNSLVLRTKTSNGITWTHTTKVASNVSADLQVKYKNKAHGSFEAKTATDGSLSSKLTLDQLYPGLAVISNWEDASKSKATVAAEYRQDTVSGSATLDFIANKADISAAVGTDGLTVGGSISVAKDASVLDYNAGVEYAQSDMTVSVTTKDKTNVASLAINHAINKEVSFNAIGSYSFVKADDKSLAVGGTAKLDNDTTLKTKLDHTGAFAAIFEHKFRSFAKLILSSNFNLKNAKTETPKFAVSLTLGETDE